MAEQTQAIQPSEKTTQTPATPTGEQKTTVEETKTQLPDEASERTKSRFDELTMQLKEERQRREALESAFQTLKPKDEPTKPEAIYDPTTGLLNEQALTNVQLRAQEAEKQAQMTQKQLDGYLEDQKKQNQAREDQEAFTAHPELDPKNDKFNKDLRDVTASIMLQSMVHPEEFGNKQLTHKEAGDKAKELIAKISGNVAKTAAQEAIEQLSPKEQAALAATGSTNHAQETDLATLRRRTQRGDTNALMERLERLRAKS